jgi:hypothetical protein
MDPVVEPIVSSMSHSELSRPKRKARIVEKRNLGPEDGYNFKVEETFVSYPQQSADSPCADIYA